MKIKILVDTKPRGGEYTKAGGTVECDGAEASRLIMLGFAEAVTAPKKARVTKEKK